MIPITLIVLAGFTRFSVGAEPPRYTVENKIQYKVENRIPTVVPTPKPTPTKLTPPSHSPQRMTATDGTVVELRNGEWWVVSKPTVVPIQGVHSSPFVTRPEYRTTPATTVPYVGGASTSYPGSTLMGRTPTFVLPGTRGGTNCTTSR